MATRENNFGLDLRKLLATQRERCEDVAKQTVMAVGRSLVMKSPVGNPKLWKHKAPKGYVGGRFRGNWQYGVNVTPSGTIQGVDPGGQRTIATIQQRVDQAQAMGVIHVFANNLPYSVPLEYGHSSQTPGGMVRLTVMEFNQYVQQAVAYAQSKKTTP